MSQSVSSPPILFLSLSLPVSACPSLHTLPEPCCFIVLHDITALLCCDWAEAWIGLQNKPAGASLVLGRASASFTVFTEQQNDTFRPQAHE